MYVCMCVYIYIYIYTHIIIHLWFYCPYPSPFLAPGAPWPPGLAELCLCLYGARVCVIWLTHYLSNAACLITSHLLHALFIESRMTTLCKMMCHC